MIEGRVVRAQSGHSLTITALCLFLALLLVGFAVLILHFAANAGGALADRFETRARLSATFFQDYVTDIAVRERVQAERLLADADVKQADFDSVVESFGFEAAVLLDSDGSLLQVWPAKPELIGKDMTIDYVHLRDAVAGSVSVSVMVPSAARASPITAVAVPYDSAAGRRVLSGAFSPAAGPLGAYLASVVPVAGGSAFLIDNAGAVLAGHNAAGGVYEHLGDLPVGLSSVKLDSQRMTAAVADVSDIPWRVVLVAPTAGLQAPLASEQTAPWALWLALGAFGCVTIVLFVRLGRARARATATAHTDSLTSLPNRRAMEQSLHQTAALCARHGVPLCALMIDIDHFKSINDTLGHDAGDRVLRAIAVALIQATRTGDIAGRWGGEEFLVLLPHTDDLAALGVAERIRDLIARTISTDGGHGTAVTASIGVAVLRHSDTSTMLHEADAALYEAKTSGRNRVELWEGSPAPSREPAIPQAEQPAQIRPIEPKVPSQAPSACELKRRSDRTRKVTSTALNRTCRTDRGDVPGRHQRLLPPPRPEY